MFKFRDTSDVSNAYRVDSRRFGNATRYPKRPRTSQSDLYIQGYRGAAAHCRARDQKITGASRSGSDLSNVEGPDAADHRGRGYRRRRRRANLLLYVRDNAGVGIRAAHDELVQRRDDLFHRSRASFQRPQW